MSLFQTAAFVISPPGVRSIAALANTSTCVRGVVVRNTVNTPWHTIFLFVFALAGDVANA